MEAQSHFQPKGGLTAFHEQALSSQAQAGASVRPSMYPPQVSPSTAKASVPPELPPPPPPPATS